MTEKNPLGTVRRIPASDHAARVALAIETLERIRGMARQGVAIGKDCGSCAITLGLIGNALRAIQVPDREATQ